MAIAVMEIALRQEQPAPEDLRLGATLKAIRKERGLTQQNVADNWGMTVDGYRPWERGQRHLRFDQIPALARALTVDPDELRRRLGISEVESSTDAVEAELRAMFGDEDAPLVAEILAAWARHDEATRRYLLSTMRPLVTGVPTREE